MDGEDRHVTPEARRSQDFLMSFLFVRHYCAVCCSVNSHIKHGSILHRDLHQGTNLDHQMQTLIHRFTLGISELDSKWNPAEIHA